MMSKCVSVCASLMSAKFKTRDIHLSRLGCENFHFYSTRTLAGDRTFTVSASNSWIDLPLTVRQSSSVSAFMNGLENTSFLIAV